MGSRRSKSSCPEKEKNRLRKPQGHKKSCRCPICDASSRMIEVIADIGEKRRGGFSEPGDNFYECPECGKEFPTFGESLRCVETCRNYRSHDEGCYDLSRVTITVQGGVATYTSEGNVIVELIDLDSLDEGLS